MANVSRATKMGKDVQVLAGLDGGVLKLDQMAVGGRIYKQTEVAALIRKRMAASQAIDQAKAAWLAAIHEFEVLDAHVDVVVRDLRHVVIGAFGEEGQELAQFNFAPPKRAVFTQEQIAETVRKRNETRKARKTMGRKQKKAIKGVMPAVVIAVAGTNASVVASAATDVTAPAPASAASPPAAEGPTGGGAGGASG